MFPFQMPHMYSEQKLASPTGRKLCVKKVALNFLAILEAIAKHDLFLEKHMKVHGNAKYTSKTIQNEMLECLAEMVQE